MAVALVKKGVENFVKDELGNAVAVSHSFNLLTRWNTSVLKSGHAMRVAKLIKEGWPIV